MIKSSKTFTTYAGSVWTVAALDANRIVSGSRDRTMKLWDVHSKQCIGTFTGHTGSVWTVTALDINRIVSGSYDKSLRMWDVHSKQCIGTFTGHSSWVSTVTALDADRIVSGSHDKTLKLWDVHNQQCIGTFTGHTDQVSTVKALNPYRILSGSRDKTLKLWDIPLPDPIELLKQLQLSLDDSQLVYQLLQQCNSAEIEVEDIESIIHLDFHHIVARWEVLSSTPFLVQWIRSQVPAADTDGWFSLRQSLQLGTVSFDALVKAYSGSDVSLRHIIALQMDSSLFQWSRACLDAWKLFSGAFVDPNVLVRDRSQLNVEFESIEYLPSSSEPLFPCPSQLCSITFDLKQATKNTKLSDECKTVHFRGQFPTEIRVTPLLRTRAVYDLTFHVHTQGASGMFLKLSSSEKSSASDENICQTSTVCLNLSGGGSGSPLMVSIDHMNPLGQKVAPSVRQLLAESKTVTLRVDLLENTLAIGNHVLPLSTSAGDWVISVGSSMRSTSISIGPCKVQQLPSPTRLTSEAVTITLDSNMNYLMAQVRLLRAFLKMSDSALEEFSTPGMGAAYPLLTKRSVAS